VKGAAGSGRRACCGGRSSRAHPPTSSRRPAWRSRVPWRTSCRRRPRLRRRTGVLARPGIEPTGASHRAGAGSGTCGSACRRRHRCLGRRCPAALLEGGDRAGRSWRGARAPSPQADRPSVSGKKCLCGDTGGRRRRGLHHLAHERLRGAPRGPALEIVEIPQELAVRADCGPDRPRLLRGGSRPG
jgi:hypothetical protein